MVLPTPPEAPVTRTGPASGVRPKRLRRSSESTAVKPAMPMMAAVRGGISSGSGTTQPAGTRAQAANPPWWATPKP